MGERTATHLCIVTAVEIEFKIATGLLSESDFSSEDQMRVCRGRAGRQRVTVLKSEIGAIGFAARLANHLERNHYDLLVVAGLAGALDPKLKIGDAVVLDLCHHGRANPTLSDSRENSSDREENVSIGCDAGISRSMLENLRAAGLQAVLGAGVTVDKIVIRAREKVSLGARYRALAVDMETYDVLTVCAMRGLPAAALRVVSDEAGTDLPDFNHALKPDGSMSGWRMGTAMLMNPWLSVRFLLGIRRVTNAFRVNLRAMLSV